MEQPQLFTDDVRAVFRPPALALNPGEGRVFVPDLENFTLNPGERGPG